MGFLTSILGIAPMLVGAAEPSKGFGVGLSRGGSTFVAGHDALFWFINWLCVFFFVLLMGLAIFFVFKYRRRPGVPAQRSTSHNTPLELAWSIIPLIILIGLFFWAFDQYMDTRVAPAGAEEITVIAKKWSWDWSYDNGSTTTESVNITDSDRPVFAIPKGRPIKLIMQSEDVIHSLFIPDFRVKLDVFPNRYTTMWFEATEVTKEGEEHYVFCAEYCGDQHSQMAAAIRVLEPEDYELWKLANGDVFGGGRSPVEVGEILYRQKACNSCHTVNGTASTGPTWLDVFGKTEPLNDGSSVMVDENYVRESIYTPAVKIVAGFTNQMTSYQGQINEKELNAIIAYMKSISTHYTGDANVEFNQLHPDSE